MRFLLAGFLTLFIAYGAFAQESRENDIAEAEQRLSFLSEELESGAIEDPTEFEREARGIVRNLRDHIEPAEEALARARDDLGLLGAAPKEGEPPEAEAIASERSRLNVRIATLRGQLTRIRAAMDQGAALLGELSNRRLRDLYRRVLERDKPIVAPSLWLEAEGEAQDFSAAVARYFDQWQDDRSDKGGAILSLAALGAAGVISFLLFGSVRKWLRRVFSQRIESHEPTPPRRVAVAGIKMLTRIIPGIVGGLIVIETARAVGLVSPEGRPVANAIWVALVAWLLVSGFASGLFAPAAPAWRLAPIEAAKGRRASALLIGIVIVVGFKSVFVEIARATDDPDALVYAARGLASLLVGGLLFALCDKDLWARPSTRAAKTADAAKNDENLRAAVGDHWPAVRLFFRLVAILVIAAAFAGHVSLADFAATRLYYLALLLAVAWFARAALKEAASYADRRLRTREESEKKTDANGAFRFWIGAGIDLVLLLLLIPVLFVLAGAGWGAVRDIFLRALIGFRIGGIVINLSDIFIAIASFVGVLLLTRVLQGALQRGPLAHSRIDSGIQNSLTTLFGYVGLVIAAVIALGVVGVDLSNLALIAGALSVGIGFGLQSIVNNFVSGLILLFERPIKVGDWIVTASGEGIVKKISVRSTEVETFDRSSIIIPNSELIASTVTNWTHKSALGRIKIPVGVSYDADPEAVREILLDCANAHPMIVRYPEPFVIWDGFGASSLDFELRAFLSDISKGLQARSELRYAIFKAFKERGVEIPYPQQDIHIRSAPAGANRSG